MLITPPTGHAGIRRDLLVGRSSKSLDQTPRLLFLSMKPGRTGELEAEPWSTLTRENKTVGLICKVLTFLAKLNQYLT